MQQNQQKQTAEAQNTACCASLEQRALFDAVFKTRALSLSLAEGLSDADATVQSMEDASPAKWHLAHTSWFFETLLLIPYGENYQVFDPHYNFLFNSYYEQVGERHPRPRRGMITRPSLDEIKAYRLHVDQGLSGLAGQELTTAQAETLLLGLEHEQQHQELLLTDILHLFSHNPLKPAYRPLRPGLALAKKEQSVSFTAHDRVMDWPEAQNREPGSVRVDTGGVTVDTGGVTVDTDSATAGRSGLSSEKPAYAWRRFEAILAEIGAPALEPSGSDQKKLTMPETFSYDCERPRHSCYLTPFLLANRPVTNGDWLYFMASGGYEDPLYWLSDGWAFVRREAIKAPLYWQKTGENWQQMSLRGLQAVDLKAPVCHISYFEADAYARFIGARLPREAEWEYAASLEEEKAIERANLLASDLLQPKPLDETLFAPSLAALNSLNSLNSLGSLADRRAEGDEAAQAFHPLFGDVWQWTQSAFAAYPGFRPLEGVASEYNGKFMCGQFVLKGGSCLTPSNHIRASYRNFFYPHQRWQMMGLRLAKDV